MTKPMTFEDLRRILIECAGLAHGVEFTDDNLDTELTELGYDSLALLETAARIKQEFGVDISDEQITTLETPRAVLDTVNEST
jgi:acyl carrier protein